MEIIQTCLLVHDERHAAAGVTRGGQRPDAMPAKLHDVLVLQILVGQCTAGLRDDALGAGQQLLQEARASYVIRMHVRVYCQRGDINLHVDPL